MEANSTLRCKIETKQSTDEHCRYSTISRDDRSVISKFSTNVAHDILQENLNTDEPKNMVCSPLPMDIMLNVVALGSKGATLDQLLGLVGCENVEKFSATVSILADVVRESKGENMEVCSVNALWIDQRHKLKELFQRYLRDLHKIDAKAVDFVNQVDEVVNEANLWAKKQSKGFIKEIVSKDHLKEVTIMLLANALYFKGTWVKKFEPDATKDQAFYLLNGEKVQVPFIYLRYTTFDYGIFEGCQVLRMLYEIEVSKKGERMRRFSMYIFLPKEKDGLSDMLSKIPIDSTTFNDKIKLGYESINVAIPKFKFQCELHLKKTMIKLGLTHPFGEDRKSSKGITEMVESPFNEIPIYVDNIIQKSHVEVDEEGTKAATSTRLANWEGCSISCLRSINFVADHPFMFMIREDYSGAILYVGTVLNP